MMKYFKSINTNGYMLTVCMAAFLLTACIADNSPDAHQSTLNVLNNNLGDTLKRKVTGDSIELSYCPDNTCLIFTGTVNREKELTDFTLLYLFNISSYVYLLKDMHGKGIFIDNVKNEATSLLLEYSSGCTGNKFDVISCSIHNLYIKGNISVAKSRFDEGQTNKNRIDIEERVSKNNLMVVKQHRERFVGR